MANNIRQLTNFSSELESASTTSETIYMTNPDDPTEVPVEVSYDYYVVPASLLTGSSSIPINKFGYVCEPKGMCYPIFLTTGGTSRVIYMGKTGIFETMPETFDNINDDDDEELDCIPKITQLEVPTNIQFKLDYVFTAN